MSLATGPSRPRGWTLLALIASLLFSPAGSCQQQSAAALLQNGISLLANGKPEAAEAVLRVAQQQLPTDPAVPVARGIAAMQRGDGATAKAHYLSALKLRPGFAPAHNAMGLLLLRAGQVRDAYTHFQNALRFAPDYGEARVNLAYTLCLQGFPAQAADQCLQTQAKLSNYPFLHEVAASADMLSGNYQLSRHRLEQLSALTTVAPAGVTLSPLSLEGRVASEPAPGSAALQTQAAGSQPGQNELVLKPSANRMVLNKPLPDPVVLTGVVAVSAAPQESEARYVTFLLDGAMKAVTNRPPYVWRWDTTALPNGPHVVTVQFYGSGGLVVAQDVRHVTLLNAPTPPPRVTPAPAPPVAVASAPQVEAALRSLLRVQADALRPRLLLAGALERGGQLQQALDAYARLYLEAPQRSDAEDAVNRLRRALHLTPGPSPAEVWRVTGTGPRVALTFDDGPRPFFTERILEILRRHDVRATFFVVGKMATAYPSLVREIAAGGHELANHSFTHPNLALLSPAEVKRELLQTEVFLHETCGVRTTLFRPPGGNYNGNVQSAVRNLGYRAIFWGPNITSWTGRPAEEIAGAMARGAENGCFLLMHNGKDETVYVLDRLIELLLRRGFSFATVSQLIESGTAISTGEATASNEY